MPILTGTSDSDFLDNADRDFDSPPLTRLEGLEGGDFLIAGAFDVDGSVTLDGGDGDDFFQLFSFDGDPEAEFIVVGGRGSDTINLTDDLAANSSVVIQDFDGLAGDIILFNSRHFDLPQASFDDVLAATIQDGDDALITLANGATVRLVDVDFTTLDDRMVIALAGLTGDTITLDPNGESRELNGTDDGETILRDPTIDGPVVYNGNGGDDFVFFFDFPFGETGGDTINGGDGNDFLTALPGDVIDGGAGIDVLDVSSDASFRYDATAGTIEFLGADGDGVPTIRVQNVEDVTGGGEANIFIGGDADEFFRATNNADTLIGGAGDDTLRTEDDDDGFFQNVIDGGEGNNTLILDHDEEDETIVFNLETGTVNLAGDNFSIANITNVIGDETRDRYIGDAQDNILRGLSGSDTLVGANGADSLFGGDGNDQLFAGMADVGNDLVAGGRGNDVGAGGAGSDTIVGDSVGRTDHEGRDTLFGGAGDDVLAVGGWRDEDGDGVLTIGELYTDGTFHETAYSGSGADRVYGADGNDTLGGGFGSDALWGFDGNDTIYGGLNSDEGSDDTIHGGAGDDQVFAAGGEDSITGGDGDDTLFAGGGDDVARGGAGNDEIYGGAGDDTLYGGDGADIFYFAAGHGTDEINDFTADDVLFLQNIADPFETVEELFASIAAGVNVVVDTGDGLIILNGVSIDDLSLDNVVI